MNRSSCLSVLLVGLSLTTASAALAAPSTTDGASPKKVALNAQTTDSSSSPTAAPTTTDPSAPSSTPAVSVGTTAPVADSPTQSAAEPAKAPKPRPFAGSSLYMATGMTTNTIFKNQTQYNDPTVDTYLVLGPRYALSDAWQLRGRLYVSYEYTNSDTTTTNHEPVLGDLGLYLYYRKIPTLPGGIQMAVAPGISLPTSKASHARTMIVTPSLTAQFFKGFEHVVGGDLSILASFAYSHPFYSSKNPEVTDDRPAGSLTCLGGTNCADLLSGKMNPSDSISYSVYIGQEWGKWNPGIYYRGASTWSYHPKEVKNPVDGTPITDPQGFQSTNLSQSHYFNLMLDYNFNSWLTGEIGFTNEVAGIGLGGQRSNIFFDRYQDTRVYFGGSIQLDNLAKAISGGNEGEGGIVRAKNSRSPMFTF
jgi:hypothetical protein